MCPMPKKSLKEIRCPCGHCLFSRLPLSSLLLLFQVMSTAPAEATTPSTTSTTSPTATSAAKRKGKTAGGKKKATPKIPCGSDVRQLSNTRCELRLSYTPVFGAHAAYRSAWLWTPRSSWRSWAPRRRIPSASMEPSEAAWLEQKAKMAPRGAAQDRDETSDDKE